jgi:hypothetical protein
MKYEISQEQVNQLLSIMSETPYKYSAVPIQILSTLIKIEEKKVTKSEFEEKKES